MKALLMAAGVGSRISRHIGGKPKCLLDVYETTLINNTINLLKENGINDISVVVGYQSEVIINELPSDIKIYKNKFFRITNSIASCWFAREELNSDEKIMILNADLFLTPAILDRILSINDNNGVTLLADSSRIADADYRFNYEGKKLYLFGKELSVSETTGEYVGIGVISGSFINEFSQRLDKLIDEEKYNSWWEDVIYSFVPNHEKIFIEDIKGLFWAEMDYIEDYQRVMNYIEEMK